MSLYKLFVRKEEQTGLLVKQRIQYGRNNTCIYTYSYQLLEPAIETNGLNCYWRINRLATPFSLQSMIQTELQ